MVETMVTKKRQLWVDYARVIAMICVIIVHSCSSLVYTLNKPEIPASYWWVGNILDAASKIATPTFLMITGYLLLGKEEPLIPYAKKRFGRILIPLAAWSLFYRFVPGYTFDGWWRLIKDILRITMEPTEYHLWFMYVMIGIYIYLPLLRVFVKHATEQQLLYFIGAWTFAVAIIPNIIKFTGVPSRFDLSMVGGYAGFLLLGRFLGKREPSKRDAIIAACVYAATLIFTVIGTYVLTVRDDNVFNGHFYGRTNVNYILMSSAFFVLVKYIVHIWPVFSSEPLSKVVIAISKASFGIYLVHAFIITVLWEGYLGFKLTNTTWHPLISVPFLTVLILAMSYAVVWTFRKIPLLRRTVG